MTVEGGKTQQIEDIFKQLKGRVPDGILNIVARKEGAIPERGPGCYSVRKAISNLKVLSRIPLSSLGARRAWNRDNHDPFGRR
jgi:hypothetical protein